MTDAKNLIELGVCGKPHGIKGGFSFKLHNPEDSILAKGSKLTLFPSNSNSSISKNGQLIEIASIAFGNKTIVYLDGITDRNLVEDMIPFSFSMDRCEFPVPADGEVYIEDLVGLPVFDAHTGNHLGEIKEFYDNGAQVVFIMNIGGKLIDIPFIDQFIPTVDLEAGRVEVFLPEYIDDK